MLDGPVRMVIDSQFFTEQTAAQYQKQTYLSSRTTPHYDLEAVLSLGKYSLHDLKYSIPINLSLGQPKKKNSNQVIQLNDAIGNTLECCFKKNPRNFLHRRDCDLIIEASTKTLKHEIFATVLRADKSAKEKSILILKFLLFPVFFWYEINPFRLKVCSCFVSQTYQMF